jgi:hypothetical protein
MPRGDGTRRGKAARSGPSGPSIPEAQRHTRRYVLRLPEAPAAALDGLCERLGVGPSAAVSLLLLIDAQKENAPG